MITFCSFLEPIAIVFCAVAVLVGSVAALWIMATTLNIVSMLGAIIGIVVKSGILILDSVGRVQEASAMVKDALVRSASEDYVPC